MDQVTQAKVLFRMEQWIKVIAECQASGLPVRTWCKLNGFKEQSFYYYLKKIREKEIKKLPIPLPETQEKPVLFKKMEVQAPVSTQAAVILHLPGASLEIQNGATQQTIEAVLLALKCLC